MEKHQHPFDDFLKEALKGHQLVPREKAKQAFLDEATAIIPARKGWNNWYFLPILVAFISGIIAVSYFINNNKSAHPVDASTDNPSSSIVTDNISTSLSKPSTPIQNSTTTSITGEEPLHIASSQPARVIKAAVSKPVDQITADASNKMDKSTVDGPMTAIELQSAIQPAPLLQNIQAVNDSSGSTTTASGIAPDSLSKTVSGEAEPSITPAAVLPVTDSGVSDMPPDTLETPDANRVIPASYFTASVGYLPELMFNTLEGSKFVNNFSLEGTYYRGLTSIRTGLGISVSKGITENSVQYSEYLGTYNKLDSITFLYNESEHDFYPDLHMSTGQVWDDTTRLDSTKLTQRYTYLQVPLVLGFDFWHNDRFTVGVRVGTIMSVMIRSKPLSGEYDPGENLVVGVAGLTPEQVNVNWQAIGGINASARLNRSFYLEMEPQARYYYQSIYESSAMTEKPWSIGIRVAVTYKF